MSFSYIIKSFSSFFSQYLALHLLISYSNLVSHVFSKTKLYSGLLTTTKFAVSILKYEGDTISSKIFGKVTETSSLLIQALLITFLLAFVTIMPRSLTAGYLDPYSLEIYKSIFLTSVLLMLL